MELTKLRHSLWQKEMREAIRDPAELCRLLELPQKYAKNAFSPATQFPLFVPRPFLERIRRGDPNDPLLLQVLPTRQELKADPHFVDDPVGDMSAMLETGLIQKYDGRVLTILSSICPVHCRYCFRRHFPYVEQQGLIAWPKILQRIESDIRIREVILSGGDPLSLSDGVLTRVIQALDAVSHLKRIRIHTRFPIMIPSRVTKTLVKSLDACSKQAIVVLHANHPNEMDGSVIEAMKRMRRSRILLFNQSVLLKGVNNDADVLAELSESLIDCGVVPYYLHQLDRVNGSRHFEVPEREGLEIVRSLQERLPGYAIPRYVRETAGEPSKSPIT